MPYWLGGVLLGLVNIGLIYVTGSPMRVVGGLVAFSDTTFVLLGVLAGTVLASAASGELRLRVPRRLKSVVAAAAGGLLMGYGTRIAVNCNVSGFIGGITSFSLHGWVYLVALAAGSAVGFVVLRRYFA